MFKNLRLYYVFISMPYVLLLLGSTFFMESIKGTITRNPHPQINYAIFVIILSGGIFILINARRLVRESRTLVAYSEAVRANANPTTLQELAKRFTTDIACLLQMLATSAGRAISRQEQAAIEHEMGNTRARLTRRNALPQYLTGLLVGMGLLGTFIGLLATLNDISVLISSFADLDMKTVDPIQVFRTMIERMKAPMQSMGIAFSASMFGLLGSIVLGLMMVGIRRLEGDIFSTLSSEVARHIEIALAIESSSPAAAAAAGGGLAGFPGGFGTGEEYKVLIRIEERLAEAARLQQRTLAAEVEDFQKQRADMLRTLSMQTEASNGLRSELQQLSSQLSGLLHLLEKRDSEASNQLSELAVHLTADAKESHKLLAAQIDEQRRLRESLDTCRIEERLAEAARLQQRTLAADSEASRQQREELLRSLAAQGEASSNLRSELQQLGRQFDALAQTMGKGSVEVREQIAELMIHMAADAKETQKLLTAQITEQARLRAAMELRDN